MPVSELELVAGQPTPGIVQMTVTKKPKISIDTILNKNQVTESFKEQEDAHYSEMTLRDLAAIFLKKPVSNKQWLNNLINNL